MIELFLSESAWSGNGDVDTLQPIHALMDDLESNLKSLMLYSGRSMTRFWLCDTVSGINSITPRDQREVFVSLLKSKPLNRSLAAKVLEMLFEKMPCKAGFIIALKCYMLENFFKGNARRILQWFSNFGGGSELEQRKGARALSRFAFMNRDNCWEELEWKGKHGQSPAMVATKPHYFLDLDVEATVENFIEYVPDFWSSKEFAESLKGGEILSIDTTYFVDFFLDLMYVEESEEVWDAIDEFLMEESFCSLCRRLLIFLEERDLYTFIIMIGGFLNSRVKSMDFSSSTSWIEIILSRCDDRESIDQILLLNAIINHGHQLLKLLHDEDGQEEVVKIKDIVIKIFMASSNCKSLDLIIKESVNKNILEVMKLLGLQFWLLRYKLSEECRTSESWESLFAKNKIAFRRSSKYRLIQDQELSEKDTDERASSKIDRKKKRKRRKTRQKKLDYDDIDGNEIMVYTMPGDGLTFQSEVGSWYLSTDGYSNRWSSIDLPEHLCKHCFATWLKWVWTKYNLIP